MEKRKGLDIFYMYNVWKIIANIIFIVNNTNFYIKLHTLIQSINIRSEWYDKSFIELCRHGKSKKVLTKYSKCRYQTKNSLYRLLMPFKEEDINSDPIIKIYHNVINDEEILKFKTMVLDTVSDKLLKTYLC